MNKTIRRKQPYINDNNIETYKSMGGAVTQSLGNDLIKGGANDFKEQLFGITLEEHYKRQKITGDLVEGEELIIKPSIKNEEASQENIKPKVDIEPGIDYSKEVIHGEKRILRESAQLIKTQIEEILIEIKKLASAQKELEVEFKEVVVVQRIVNTGKYHLNFFEWVLSSIRLARMKVEDSGAWLSAFQSKKSKREYWAMFKKHGTTFGLSNERVVATQTG